ncbi:MAG: SEC-C domain-containing protein [Myxococcota bacterium]|nr:SEC-C domain-containing protein [Myxococcota bacterium]
MKLGRNDPCHCGSGKKYKKCHQPIDENAARNVRSLRTPGDWFGHHVERLNAAGLQHLSENTIVHAAWSRWPADDSKGPAFDDYLFRQHVLFDLVLAENRRFVHELAFGDDKANSEDLDALRDALAATHVSALEVTACRRGQTLRLLDRLVGHEVEVKDVTAPKPLEPMEVIIGRVATWKDQTFLVPGWERVYFRGRKAAIQAIENAMDMNEYGDEDQALRRAWVQREAISVIQTLRAAQPNHQ